MHTPSRVAAFIVNFNMPERTNALAEHIKSTVRWPLDLFVIDNGSDIAKPSLFTNVWLSPNRQTTGGWLAALDQLKWDYFAYWFLITSAEFVDDTDPLTPMAEWLALNPRAVGVHPALTEDSTTYWEHLKTRGGLAPRPTWMIDNIASLYRADWFDSIGRFDPDLTYAWGIDLETCWKARQQGRSLWVDERVRVKKVTNIGYALNRMGMDADERARNATENMRRVLTPKYGPDYYRVLTEEYVDDALR